MNGFLHVWRPRFPSWIDLSCWRLGKTNGNRIVCLMILDGHRRLLKRIEASGVQQCRSASMWTAPRMAEIYESMRLWPTRTHEYLILEWNLSQLATSVTTFCWERPLLLLPSAARWNHSAARVALCPTPWPTSNKVWLSGSTYVWLKDVKCWIK